MFNKLERPLLLLVSAFAMCACGIRFSWDKYACSGIVNRILDMKLGDAETVEIYVNMEECCSR